jgi:tRNA threonylcarbamoyladenosine biosynthesis protein TsaE
MNYSKKIISAKLMVEFGQALARACTKDGVGKCMIYLHGELGAGKTTLVRGFLRGCGYSAAVKSPTYTIVEPYKIEHKIIYHFDLYRLTNAAELAYIGGRDYFGEDAICLIEWPEHGSGFLPAPDLVCVLTQEQGNLKHRTVLIRATSEVGQRILRNVSSAKKYCL